MAAPRAFARELQVATAGLEPAAINQRLIATARKALAEAQARGEAPANYIRIVNGVVGAPEESVKTPGPIVYIFSNLQEIAAYAVAFCEERSPVRSGKYKRSWFALVNGRQWDGQAAIDPDAELIIVNDRPYHRKIEVGAMKMRVPPGIVQDARQAVMRRFGNTVTAQVQFINLAGGYILKRGSGTRPGRRRGDEITYPALVVTMRFADGA